MFLPPLSFATIVAAAATTKRLVLILSNMCTKRFLLLFFSLLLMSIASLCVCDVCAYVCRSGALMMKHTMLTFFIRLFCSTTIKLTQLGSFNDSVVFVFSRSFVPTSVVELTTPPSTDAHTHTHTE